MATARTGTTVRSRTLGPRIGPDKPRARREEGPRLTVECSGGEIRTTLRVGGETLWSGPWGIEIRCGGRRLVPPGRWHEVCWQSDDGVQCLELEGDFSAALRVQRLFVLSWKERFALVADAVFAPGTAELDYCARLSLGEPIRFVAEEESWEGFLASRGRRALVLPLGLPEWRTAPAAGALRESEAPAEPSANGRNRRPPNPNDSQSNTSPTRKRGTGNELPSLARRASVAQGHQLELRQAARGRALWAPLFIDLDAQRFRRKRTWRTLTVAENRQALPPDVAVGYRVLVGSRQWLIYRSLAEKANRSVLGHNLSTEMLVARFERKGQVEPIIEIE